MKSQTHICTHERAPHSAENAGRIGAVLRRVWFIVRAVLRGYCAGQPIDEARPRKGCC
ncbi:MAG: hypothetical protein JNJ50_27965 [Acidobacteria bacterium]|nr:hypothetical protein [Acidobacteriota bacterium]